MARKHSDRVLGRPSKVSTPFVMLTPTLQAAGALRVITATEDPSRNPILKTGVEYTLLHST